MLLCFFNLNKKFKTTHCFEESFLSLVAHAHKLSYIQKRMIWLPLLSTNRNDKRNIKKNLTRACRSNANKSEHVQCLWSFFATIIFSLANTRYGIFVYSKSTKAQIFFSLSLSLFLTYRQKIDPSATIFLRCEIHHKTGYPGSVYFKLLLKWSKQHRWVNR